MPSDFRNFVTALLFIFPLFFSVFSSSCLFLLAFYRFFLFLFSPLPAFLLWFVSFLLSIFFFLCSSTTTSTVASASSSMDISSLFFLLSACLPLLLCIVFVLECRCGSSVHLCRVLRLHHCCSSSPSRYLAVCVSVSIFVSCRLAVVGAVRHHCFCLSRWLRFRRYPTLSHHCSDRRHSSY